MSIEIIQGNQSQQRSWDYLVKSTDTKPTGVPTGSTLWVLDTQTAYIYSPSNLNPATSDYWWEV